ncbi:lipopolysaccharide biosynthesis protein [Chitinophaga sp. GCM10012297]|uniref:Membrane protein involved in the export of O-antigen and teichoic acid n=1 Tax=Chitinophaga chungangae TaxID=2821488 RepID=A0ABS3YB49_9BACT|nr:hypothetical protein [Chitinophaga chungangae]MBO9151876.1 hypothetical protein [Chitinophaga chungangae]
MGIIRNQSIKSSILTYVGFGIGGIYTLLLAKLIDPNINGLFRFFVSVATIVCALSNLGSVSVMNKFYPYYRDLLQPPRRDILGLVLIFCGIGFLFCTAGFFVFEDLVIRKFGTKSNLVVEYYYFLIPFSFFYLFFVTFENYSYNQFKSLMPIALKEVGLRLLNVTLAVLFLSGVFRLAGFVWAYSMIYGVLLAVLLIYLYRQRDLLFTFKISNVTRRLAGKMITFNATLYLGAVMGVVAQNFDNLSISSAQGLSMGFVYEFATYVATVILVPQRSIIAISIPVLAKAWKDRDLSGIQSIYRRSSNTMFSYSLLVFLLIWMNVDSVFSILALDEIYNAGKPVIFILGSMRVIEMSFGVNSQIIGTSNYWRVNFFSELVQFALVIPLNLYFNRLFGIQGNALANLLSLIVFGLIRYSFLLFKFRFQPWTMHTFYILCIAASGYFICTSFSISNPYVSLIFRSVVFAAWYVGLILIFKLSNDVTEGWNMVWKRLKRQ